MKFKILEKRKCSKGSVVKEVLIKSEVLVNLFKKEVLQLLNTIYFCTVGH